MRIVRIILAISVVCMVHIACIMRAVRTTCTILIMHTIHSLLLFESCRYIIRVSVWEEEQP